jgi:hypothetical protein
MVALVRRNQFLILGCLAGLLGGPAPALASSSSFDVIFNSSIPNTSTESTGVSGKMTFNFAKNSGNEYTLDLDIFNTSPVLSNPTGTLAGFAFNVPGKSNIPPDFLLLTYDPLGSVFRKDIQPGNFSPFGSFSFCARESGNNCVGGQANDNGLADGESAKVRLTLASNVSTVDTAEKVAQSFFNLFNSWNPATNPNGPQVALRFQQVTTSKGKSGESEKVGGLPKPPQGPGDEVPGPLPVLGATTAFAFSRKLRRRIAVANRKTAVTD